jgi:predicted acetyltransferase
VTTHAGIEIRPIGAGELEAFFEVPSRALGFPMPSPEQFDLEREHRDLGRTLAGLDGGSVVATTDSHLFDLTVPGPAAIPVAGVTAVAVRSTHRRRGLVRALMERQLSEARERGEVAAVLLASESVIYGRFGYGAATLGASLEIDPSRSVFASPNALPGRVLLVDRDRALELQPGVFTQAARSRPGGIPRPDAFWLSAAIRKDGDQAFYAVYEATDGSVDGYATYDVRSRWEEGLPDYQLTVQELVTASPEAYAALWRHVLDVDLVTKVSSHTRPPDEALRWMLADPRRLRMPRCHDFLWVRPLDVPRSLEARTYAADGGIVIRVADTMFGDGTYELSVSDGRGHCTTTDASPDLGCGIADLGATYLGGVSFAELATAGRVVELTTGAVRRADVLFASRPLPWCQTWF